MKKSITTLALCLMAFGFLNAQTFPYGINYQAVARDAFGNAKTGQVPIQYTIYQHSASGTMVYQERQVLTTNNMGQFNAVIGKGAPVTPFTSASFSQIAWGADSTFLKIEINSNTSFTGTFTPMGNTTKFQAVPYAMYSMATNLKVPTVQIFKTGSSTYTPPAGVLYIEVEMVGGGGGGNSNANYATAGGGAGGYLKFIITNPTSYSYSIGIGGTGTAAGVNADATNGNNTTFGSNIAGGGTGAAGLCVGGPGGTNTFVIGTSMVNMQGNGGGGRYLGGSGQPYALGGYGGSGPFGGGTNTNDNSANNAANAPANSGSGAAGGSGSNGGACGAGGNGGSGIIIVKEYYQ